VSEPRSEPLFLRPRRNAVLKRSRRRRFVRRGAGTAAATVAVVAVAAWLGAAGLRWLERTPLLALSSIRIEGVARADRAEVTRILERHLGENTLSLDLDAVRAELLGHPWVRDALVRRVLPRTIAATLTEKEPAAIAVLDGAPRIVDAGGVPIVEWSPRGGRLNLPLITGADEGVAPAGDARRRADAVRQGLVALTALRAHDAELMADVAEVDVSRPDRFTLRLLDEPAPIWLSRENPAANIDHYFAVRQDMRARIGAVAAVDLRWRGRVTVVPAPGAADPGQQTRKALQDG
jgi:cell division protein FtsQ